MVKNNSNFKIKHFKISNFHGSKEVGLYCHANRLVFKRWRRKWEIFARCSGYQTSRAAASSIQRPASPDRQAHVVLAPPRGPHRVQRRRGLRWSRLSLGSSARDFRRVRMRSLGRVSLLHSRFHKLGGDIQEIPHGNISKCKKVT